MMSVVAMDMDPDLTPGIRDEVAMIRRNVELEAKLIDDLLDLSRVTAGKLHLHFEAVDVSVALRHVYITCRSFTLEKGIHLHSDLQDNVHYVMADSGRLQQILWNLLKNAAKFTPKGGDIYVTVSTARDDCVRIQVRDTGIGIEPHVLPRIFDAFEQGDANITRQFGGMGLGLAITKGLVELHRGTIRVESGGANQGATFTVELPKVPAPEMTRQHPKGEGENSNPLRVLLVEDHADTARVLSKLLIASGHKVKTASNVAAALTMVQSESFDVLVSDIGLPDATGYELMEQIRSRYSMKGIAMSGYGMDEDLRKSRAAGFSDHIVKPANVAQLERAIRRVVGKGD
jgi:CheY-like chemotaxis protein/two-component sensor histidine kinase